MDQPYYTLRSTKLNGGFSTLRPRKDGRRLADDIFSNDYIFISIIISQKFIPKGPIKIFQHWFR